MNYVKLGLALFLCLAILPPALGSYERIFVLIFENTDRLVALGDPNFASLLDRGLLLDNFYATTHPSQPNYIALVAGDVLGVTTNSRYNLTETFLGSLLVDHGKTWKSYQENYPGGCFLSSTSPDSLYVRKHNPFVSFTSVTEDAEGLCLNNVPATQLNTDIEAGELPNFMFFTPNMNNGAHDTSITFAGNWLNGFLPPLLDNEKFMNGTLVIVTFDEGYTSSPPEENKVYTLLIGEGIPTGVKTSERYDHYSLLRTIEDNWELGTLGRNDSIATPVNFTLYDQNPAAPVGSPLSGEPATSPLPQTPTASPSSGPTATPSNVPRTATVSSAHSQVVAMAWIVGYIFAFVSVTLIM